MRLVTIALSLIFLSSNFANATSISKLYIKQANTPTVTNHEQAKELANMKTQLKDITNLQITPETTSSGKLARKGGGKTASTDILGTYRLTDSSLTGSLFLDIIDASLKNDTGLIEFVLSDSQGFVSDHSIGILVNNTLSFQSIFFGGAQFYVINLNPKKNYSGQGASFYDVQAGNCYDDSGDGFVDISEFYACQYFGSDPQAATITLDRIR